MAQQIIMRPAGIVTSPNKLGSMPDGAMSKAMNALMRVPGIVESSKTWVVKTNLMSLSGIADPAIYCFDFGKVSQNQLNLVVFQASGGVWKYAFVFLGNGIVNASGLFKNESVNMFPSAYGGARMISVGYHSMVNCDLGHVVFDLTIAPSGIPPREAGLYSPTGISSSNGSDNDDAGALQLNTHCHSTAVFRRTFSQFAGFEADPYELVSAPTVACHTYGPFAPRLFTKITHVVSFQQSLARAGDLLEIYRTRSQKFASILDYVNTGSDFYLSASTYLTAAQVVAGVATIVDVTPDSALGESLYTNDGLQGAESAALPPPSAQYMCMFKGHCHFFNTIQPPSFNVRTAYAWSIVPAGVPAEIRLQAYGGLSTTFTATNGSNVLSGISALEMNGLVVGQVLDDSSGFSGSPVAIVSVGTTSVTVDKTRTGATGSLSRFICDRITIDGQAFRCISVRELTLVTGSQYDVYNLSFVIPPIVKYFPPFDTTPADYITIRKRPIWGNYDFAKLTMNVSATRGFLLDPKLPETSSGITKTFTSDIDFNGWCWSEKNQPENVPISNQDFVGSGTIFAAIETRDCIWVNATDGLWRISGTGGKSGDGYDWRCDIVDPSLVFSGPQAYCVIRDVVYAYTNRGFVGIYPDGTVQLLTRGRLDDAFPGSRQITPFEMAPDTVLLVIADEKNDEVIIRLLPDVPGVVWRYSIVNDAFTQEQVGATLVGGTSSNSLEAVFLARAQNGGELVINSPSTYAQMDLEFQTLYADNPFVQRHWKNVNVAVEDITDNVSVLTNGIDAGTRTLAPGGVSIESRQAFSVPRNAPAIANNLQVGVSFAADGEQVRLQAVSIDFEDLTDQRKNR